MPNKIEIEWLSSPFGHARYTLFTSEKQMKKAGFEPCHTDAPAVTHFYDDDRIVVLFKKKIEVDEDEKIALLVHESVHVWQEIKLRMDEVDPSKEFEAYSVQTIFLGLLSLYR